jgi:SAM-dependent methyltransferase
VTKFRPDLYRGSAGYYDRYRLPYPDTMLADLIEQAGVGGRGRLLDLACGTGQLAFPLSRWFGEVWAVDAEPDMIAAVRAKAAAAATGAEAAKVRPVVSRAETLPAEPGYFELAVIGNAFHRLDRDLVSGRVLGWLQPGGHLALCGSSVPWEGEGDWHRALDATLARWKKALGAEDRIPAGWELPRQLRPDAQVLADAGFISAGRRRFTLPHRWTVPELAGFIRSTSFLPASVLGDQADAFDADLAASLRPYTDDGALTQAVNFDYELARKPAAA